jgi:menaquinone-specific isochorismate synthase
VTATGGPLDADGPAAWRATARAVEPPARLLDLAGPDGFVWLNGGRSFVALGRVATLDVGTGPGRFARAAREVDALLAAIDVERGPGLDHARPRVVGALPFGDDAPGQLVLPRRIVAVEADGSAWELVVEDGAPTAGSTPPDGSDRAGPARPGRFDVHGVDTQAAWIDRVERAVAAIKDGVVDKVVLSRRVTVEADAPFDRTEVLTRLREANPSCFVYAAGAFVGATPELLVRRRGAVVESVPMAGTVRQGSTDDDRLAAALAASDKDLVEHRLVIESVAATLAPLTSQLDVPERPSVVRLATLAHLHTPIRGELVLPAPSALALAGRLHPTPAVGGSPTARALPLIRELEGFDRGRYAGPVGWVDDRGDGEWAVALRGGELDGATARLVAGAGIVEGSDPLEEWAETQTKFEPMLRALLRV